MNSLLIQLLLNTIAFLLATVGCLVIGALTLNNLPMGDPPGFLIRLKTYLTTNVAETRRAHLFPELELPCLPIAPGMLFTRLEHTIDLLDWEVIDSDHRRQHLHAVVETPLLHFKDDVMIWLEPTSAGTELHIRSSSRAGRGDLGTNTRHILDILHMLQQQI